ncbi:MAG: ABC transporter permease, partial [Comamonas sp.]
MARPPSFIRSLIDTLRAATGDVGVLLLLVGAPVLYGFFYPWFYADEVVQRVPVAVVQQDGSGLARQTLRFAQASPRIAVTLVTGDEAQAQQA